MDPKATATAIISEPKILDLGALFGKKSNSSFNSAAKNSSPTSVFAQRSLSQVKSSVRPDNAELSTYDHLNTLLQQASTSNGDGNNIIQVGPNQMLDLTNSRKSWSPWNARLCFSESYIFYKDNKLPTREFGESGVQFKCTHPGCQKRLSTNVNFVNHVWAHAKNLHFKVASNDPLYYLLFGLNEMEFLVPEEPLLHCLECLSEFTSTQKLYRHLFYVHRFGLQSNNNDHPVCHICEKEIDPANAEKHADKHGEFEMPFECPICGWRSSSRQSLLFHIERNHNASTTLVCPFCFEKFTAKRPSAVKSQRAIFTSDVFVEHLLEHFQDGVKKTGCTRCSLKFCADSYKDLTEKLRLHSELHRSASKLKFERKSLQELYMQNPNQRQTDMRVLSASCSDCGYMIKSIDSHYRKKQVCENQDCLFETRCKFAFKQHVVLCPMKENAKSRIPYGRRSLTGGDHLMNSLNKERIRLRCSLCLFASRDSAAFNEHLFKECVGAKPLLGSKSKLELPKKRHLSEDKSLEAELFAIHEGIKRVKSDESSGFLEKDLSKDTNWLAKVVPFITDRNLVVFKKSAIVTTVSIIDRTNPSATNDFFSITKFFSEDNGEDMAAKIGFKLFPPSRFPQRKM